MVFLYRTRDGLKKSRTNLIIDVVVFLQTLNLYIALHENQRKSEIVQVMNNIFNLFVYFVYSQQEISGRS